MNYKINGLCALLVFVLGILFFCYDNEAINHAVLVMCGVAFFIPGLLLGISAFAGKSAKSAGSGEKALRIVCGIAGVALGIVIWSMPDSFIGLTVYLFGGLLIFAGVFHLIQMSSKERMVAYPGWLLIGPVVNIALGVVLLTVNYFHTQGVDNNFWLIFVTAGGMLIFGIVGMFMSVVTFRASHARKLAEKAAEKGASADALHEKKMSARISDAMKVSDSETPAPRSEKPEEKQPRSDEYQGH